jgi:phosphopantothenoylcysteine decarboxylase/phosphopantothenate--cysteine ligase
MANGICDNLLLATYLSAKCPVFFAPAMDLDMWKHPSTTQNVDQLAKSGNRIIQPAYGELASGLIGEGRMAEPEEIVDFLNQELKKKLPLSGKKALVTAGPTYEAIDPVRFIGNHSSGKMGFCIAEELYQLGAEVVLISGPSAQQLNFKQIKRVDVVSAAQMHEAVSKHYSQADITVMSAAVADYQPELVAKEKIKKKETAFSINLVKTVDILSELGSKKKSGQVLIGFALETEHEQEHAIQKLQKKNLDLIVLNSLKDEGAGFKGDTNKITLIDKKLEIKTFELKTKNEVATDICQKILSLL